MSIASRLVYLPYRVLRRFSIANVCCFFAAEFSDLEATDLPDRMVFTELTPSILIALCKNYPEKFGFEHQELLKNEQTRGFAVFDGESLASSIWMAKGNIPGEINHDGNNATQLPLYLPNGMAYVFSVFVLPEYRGRRLYSSMISQLTKLLSSQGFTRLMLTTEGSNHRALRSVRRMGFQFLGRSMLFSIGGFTVAKYPPQPMSGGIQFGRYKGDQRV
tara:strand:- start:1085 stop:1738 length:654 start_codon:yes stop_codon:yes gene_type:complete